MRSLPLLVAIPLATLAFSGCDLFGGKDPESILISIDGGVRDTTLHIGESYALELDDLFHLSETGALSYVVQADPGVVGLKIDGGNVLVVEAQARGATTVIVTARAPNADPKDVQFSVSVFCQSEPDGDEASYFPSELGQQWAYDYREHSYPQQTSPFEDTTTGILTWRISKREDHCARVDLEITESFEGQHERKFMGDDDTTFVEAWEKVLSARLEGRRLIIEGYTDGSFQALDSLQWMYPNTAPEVVALDSTVFCGFGGCTTIHYALQRGMGLTHWAYDFNHRDLYSKSLALRP